MLREEVCISEERAGTIELVQNRLSSHRLVYTDGIEYTEVPWLFYSITINYDYPPTNINLIVKKPIHAIATTKKNKTAIK